MTQIINLHPNLHLFGTCHNVATARRVHVTIAPAELGFSAGYLGIPGTQFSDIGGILGDLNWQQRLNDGNAGILIRRLDVSKYEEI
jgi:hypothetical protein